MFDSSPPFCVEGVPPLGATGCGVGGCALDGCVPGDGGAAGVFSCAYAADRLTSEGDSTIRCNPIRCNATPSISGFDFFIFLPTIGDRPVIWQCDQSTLDSPKRPIWLLRFSLYDVAKRAAWYITTH